MKIEEKKKVELTELLIEHERLTFTQNTTALEYNRSFIITKVEQLIKEARIDELSWVINGLPLVEQIRKRIKELESK